MPALLHNLNDVVVYEGREEFRDTERLQERIRAKSQWLLAASAVRHKSFDISLSWSTTLRCGGMESGLERCSRYGFRAPSDAEASLSVKAAGEAAELWHSQIR